MAQIRLRLRVVRRGDFPAVCASCGQEATTTQTKSMTWFPLWVYALLPAGVLPFAIVANILTKRADVTVPFCEEHKGHWFNRNLLLWGTFFLLAAVGAGAFFFAVNLPRPQNEDALGYVCVAGLGLLVLYLGLVIGVRVTAIRPTEITYDEIQLTGVSEAFVAAVEAEAEERYPRRGGDRWRDEEDDDMPRRRRRGPDDAFEE
jgi:hypothetical protein